MASVTINRCSVVLMFKVVLMLIQYRTGPQGIQQYMENQKKFGINIFRKRVVQHTCCETHCSWAFCCQTTCYTILYYTILYYATLYYTILYYTILYYTILYYTILH